MHYVYLLRSTARPEKTYIGHTDDVQRRLAEHNQGDCVYTTKYRPWEIVALLGTPSPKKAVDLDQPAIPLLGVWENIFLGHEPTSTGFLRKREMRRRATEVMQRLGSDIDVETPAGMLPRAEQRVRRDARAVAGRKGLMIARRGHGVVVGLRGPQALRGSRGPEG